MTRLDYVSYWKVEVNNSKTVCDFGRAIASLGPEVMEDTLIEVVHVTALWRGTWRLSIIGLPSVHANLITRSVHLHDPTLSWNRSDNRSLALVRMSPIPPGRTEQARVPAQQTCTRTR